MGRLVEERWLSVSYDVIVEQLPIGDEQGRPLVDETGQPKTLEHTTLVFIHQLPDGQRIVRVPFTPEAKTELVRKLTGGIVVANGRPPVPPGQPPAR